MTISMIDFPNKFTGEQIAYISQMVVEKAREVCGDKLREVILFGSYARGDFHEWSDVDIMVIADVDEIECKRIDDSLMHELFELDNRMNLLLYIIVTSYAQFNHLKDIYPLYRNIDKEGKRLCSIPAA